jgi:hypothetical protein
MSLVWVLALRYIIHLHLFYNVTLFSGTSCTTQDRSTEPLKLAVGRVPMKLWYSLQLVLSSDVILYTGCPERNVPDFGRMLLKLKYTDITQNTYIQSWTVTEIMEKRKVWSSCGSMYCTWFAWRITCTLRTSIVQSTAPSSNFMLW